jgi:hypothetical protein
MFHTLAFSLILAVATPAPTQPVLATKLAEALANSGGYHTAKIYVGSLPPRFSNSAALPDFTIIGSIVDAPEEISPGAVKPAPDTYTIDLQPMASSTIFYEIPEDVRGALSTYESRLIARGWRPFSPTPFFDYGDLGHLNRSYCSSKAVLEILRFRALPRDIAITAMNFPGAAMWCKAMASVAAPSPPPFPNLRAPAHSRVGGDVMGVRIIGDSQEALVTAQPIGVAGSALAAQLVSSGWSANAPARSSSVYLQTFHRTRQGLHYQIVLSLIKTASHRYALYLSESLLDGPPSSLQ